MSTIKTSVQLQVIIKINRFKILFYCRLGTNKLLSKFRKFDKIIDVLTKLYSQTEHKCWGYRRRYQGSLGLAMARQKNNCYRQDKTYGCEQIRVFKFRTSGVSCIFFQILICNADSKSVHKRFAYMKSKKIQYSQKQFSLKKNAS